MEQQLIPNILHLLAGGGLGMASAALAAHFGYRSADRLPGESRTPECVFCLRPLLWFEFFPLFGWLLRRDALALPCPCGKRKGQWPQPAVELLGFALGAIAVALAGWNWTIVPLCLGLGLLPAIGLIDLAFGVIPDGLNLLLAAFGFGWIVAKGDVFMGLVTATGLLALGLLLALGYSKWRGREMLGLGDVKFFAAAGLWLPVTQVPVFLFAAGILGVLLGLLWQRAGGGKEFPFAPALCLSLAGCVFFQLWQAL